MGRIVAIGGGEIGRPGYSVETLEIDKEIKSMTGKSYPRLVFLSTASNDSTEYIEAVHKHFGERLGCQVNSIELHNKSYSTEELEAIIFSSDIIYVGGGNTKVLLDQWACTELDKILTSAYEKTDIILSGLSAGAICWFEYGSSDFLRFENPDSPLIMLPCLGLVEIAVCPHFDVEQDRRSTFKNLLKPTGVTGLGIDNCCAVILDNGKYRIKSSKPDASAWLSVWREERFIENRLGDGTVGKADDLFLSNVR